MSIRKSLPAALALVLLFGVELAAGAAALAQVDTSPDDAYTVWLCPMHRDHQAHDEGRCPLCGMALVRRTLVTRYVCLGQEEGMVEAGPGICPGTGEPLVPATREVVWFCAVRSRAGLRRVRCL